MSDKNKKHALLPSVLTWAKVAATPFTASSGVITLSSPRNMKKLASASSSGPALVNSAANVWVPSDKSWAEVAVTLPSPGVAKKVSKANKLNGDQGITLITIKSDPLISSDLSTKSNTNSFNLNEKLPSTLLNTTPFTTDDNLSVPSGVLSSNIQDTTSITMNDDLSKPSDLPPALPNTNSTITDTDQLLLSSQSSVHPKMDSYTTVPDASSTTSKNAKKNQRRKVIEKANKAQGFIIKEIECKGRGLVAFKSFKKGQQIFREAPLLRGDRGSRVWIVVEAIFTALSPENQAKVMALDDSHGCKCGKIAEECIDSPLEKRWFENAFSKEVGKLRGEYLFSSASLLNHSCDANGSLVFASNGDIVFFAKKEIKKGDELTISYRLTQKGSHRNRQLLLLKEYGFKCCCNACIGEQILKDETSDMLLYHQELPNTLDEAAALGLLIIENAATIGLLNEEEEDKRMKVMKWGERLLLTLAAEDLKLCESVIEYRGVYGDFPDPANLDPTRPLDMSKQRSILHAMNEFNLGEELLESAIRTRIGGAVRVVKLEWDSNVDQQVEHIKKAQINSLLKKHLERLVRTEAELGQKPEKVSNNETVDLSSKLKSGQKSEETSNTEATEAVGSSSKLEAEVKTADVS